MMIDQLAPLVGCWRGRAEICFPGRDRLELTHTEHVRWVGDRSMITIEGNSFRSGTATEPVFTALAVIFSGDDLARDDQLHWHAFRGGHVLQTVATVADGSYQWTVPSPAGAVDYRAEFDGDSWQEWGVLAAADGDGQRVFSMELLPSDTALSAVRE